MRLFSRHPASIAAGSGNIRIVVDGADLPLSKPGEPEVHCGMGMLRGRMVVR